MGAFSTGVRVDWGLSQQPVHVDCGLLYTTGQRDCDLLLLILMHFLPLISNLLFNVFLSLSGNLFLQ